MSAVMGDATVGSAKGRSPADIDAIVGDVRQWVQDLLWSNAPVHGRHVVKGKLVQLSDIEVAVLNILATFDHIVSNGQSLPLADLVGSDDVQTEILRAGHLGIMAGHKTRGVMRPTLSARLAARSGVQG